MRINNRGDPNRGLRTKLEGRDKYKAVIPPNMRQVQFLQVPNLKKAAEKLINNDIRGSIKKTYKSKVEAFATYCLKKDTNTKFCHPNVVINFFDNACPRKRVELSNRLWIL